MKQGLTSSRFATGSKCLAFAMVLAALSAPLSAAEPWPLPPEFQGLIDAENYADALAVVEAGKAECEASGPTADECLYHVLILAPLAQRAGDEAKRLRYAKEAAELVERVLPAGHRYRGDAYGNYGFAPQAAEDFALSADYYRKQRAVLEKNPAATEKDLGRNAGRLAQSLDVMGQYEAAAPYFTQALELWKSDPDEDPTDSYWEYSSSPRVARDRTLDPAEDSGSEVGERRLVYSRRAPV